MGDIVNRIEKELELPFLLEKLSHRLPPSDFNSLLLEVFSAKAEALRPPALLKNYANNPYSKPANWNAAKYRKIEYEMLEAAERAGVEGILLSPASTFGSCSTFGAVSQSKIISAARNLEILSDATNMLTLYIADALKSKTVDNTENSLHFCATHRHIRYQAQFKANRFPHFGLFTMVSAGQSRSSYGFEIDSLVKHIGFYADYWKRYHYPLFIKLNKRGGYKDIDGFFSRTYDALTERLPGISISIDEKQNDTIYYQGLRATMNIRLNGNDAEIGDMGFTDWTQKLLGRPGERLLISSLSLDVQMIL